MNPLFKESMVVKIDCIVISGDENIKGKKKTTKATKGNNMMEIKKIKKSVPSLSRIMPSTQISLHAGFH